MELFAQRFRVIYLFPQAPLELSQLLLDILHRRGLDMLAELIVGNVVLPV